MFESVNFTYNNEKDETIMKLLLDLILLVVGFCALLKGADWLVDGAVGFAKKFHIPTLVIGMTIVAFGTSAPEAAVSISAAVAGNNAISLSNVVGSNIFNLLVVAGLCGAIKPLPIQRIAVTRDYPFHLLITAVLIVLCLDNVLNSGQMMLSRADGLILLMFMGIYMYININDGRQGDNEENTDKEFSFIKSLSLFLIGLACVIVGGDVVVDSSTGIARAIGISDTLIGLTIVALGTSLPELMTSIVASKKGEVDLAWGNVVGSNIFNILFVLGISSAVHPFPIEPVAIFDLLFLFVISLAVYFATMRSKRLGRSVGISMIAAYAIYTVYIIMR